MMKRTKTSRLPSAYSRIFLTIPCAILLATSGISCPREAAEEGIITTGTLFEEMIDLESLSIFPRTEFRNIQFSSYDRRSTMPGGPDWYANSDGFGNEPVPNVMKVIEKAGPDGIGKYLIAEAEGPGAIVRTWIARIQGSLELYLDGSEKPVYSGPATDFFRNPYDGFAAMEKIEKARFSRTIYQRDASYAPMPFAKGMKVIWTGDLSKQHYYQLQILKYEDGTRVKSFSPDDIGKYAETINHVTMILDDPDRIPDLTAGDTETGRMSASIGPGERGNLWSAVGPAEISELRLKLRAEDINKALRQNLINIVFDGSPETEAQVQCPVGDFFGAAPGINPYRSLPFAVEPDGTMICRFVMPFRESCRIYIENFSDQETGFEASIVHKPITWTPSRMYFRAHWRINNDLRVSIQTPFDLPFLLARGKGCYVGTTSFVLNTSDVTSSWGNWWGEGDEKVYVDDESFPGIFGTGTEDYYNYSYSSQDIFIAPYCGQPRNDGPGNRGFVTNYRWHVLDPILFDKNIAFYIELYCHSYNEGFSYARTSYYYALPGTVDDHVPIQKADLRELELHDNWQPAGHFGSANAVFYEAEEILPDLSGVSPSAGRLWSHDTMQVWKPAGVGDQLRMKFRVDTSGMHQVHLTMALTPESGRIRVLLDGKALRELDLYKPYRRVSREINLGTPDLKAGMHDLVLEYTGKEESVKTPEIGIDFIWIKRER